MFPLLLLICALALPASNAVSVDPSSSGLVSPVVAPPAFVATPPVARSIEPVIFSAIRASDKSRKSNSKIFFDTTLSDVGFGWNVKSSEFVCFYPGSYFFTFTAVSDSGSHFKAALMKNSEEVATIWGERVGYQSASNTVILNLEKNDRVFVNLKEGEIYETSKAGRGYTTFSGFRLF
ncbi:hypothetical protein GHT06_016367 [Daphnia sinensis]|uniref:C1q domain-containing protein n=1 Tax=Daphnia sinensis TaxID=1820382 RepID=A0AAD5PRE2_9CRUS|nr:hypothetical protein GHT06_016367 [Daphnia sinensis]